MKLRLHQTAKALDVQSDLPWSAAGSAPDYLCGPPKPAAVLIPLTRIRGQIQVVYIRRTHHQSDRHSGQVAFPGGRIEIDDVSPESAALREAEEEIGLPRQQVRVLGRLPCYLTISNYWVTPVVGCFNWTDQLRADPREVARIFTIPLAWLVNPAHYQLRPRPAPIAGVYPEVVYFKNYDGEILWGATARMTLSLLQMLEY